MGLGDKRAMMSLDTASDALTELVKSSVSMIINTELSAENRRIASRNSLSEAVFSHWELASMLAVAIDRIAMWATIVQPSPREPVTGQIGGTAGGGGGITCPGCRQPMELDNDGHGAWCDNCHISIRGGGSSTKTQER